MSGMSIFKSLPRVRDLSIRGNFLCYSWSLKRELLFGFGLCMSRNSVGYCCVEAPVEKSPCQGICNNVYVTLSGLVISVGHRLPSGFRAMICRGYSGYNGQLHEAEKRVTVLCLGQLLSPSAKFRDRNHNTVGSSV